MALTGDQFDAATAERFGLINRSVPASELEQATQELAGKIASRSAESIARGKSAFYRQVGDAPLIRRSSWPNLVMRDVTSPLTATHKKVSGLFWKNATPSGLVIHAS
ncbi:MAG: hypothetical protein CM15mP74_08630 [Halieaceae bacterium]|nr:MAG: hypothetical protein CM15mP74_08630 [Halieaceae bacterium]